MEVVSLAQKFSLFSDYWSPKIVAELNGQQVKVAKLKGEFIWHHHEHEDELFLVMKGCLRIRLRDREVIVNEGEFFVVPKGVEHQPIAEEEVEEEDDREDEEDAVRVVEQLGRAPSGRDRLRRGSVRRRAG